MSTELLKKEIFGRESSDQKKEERLAAKYKIQTKESNYIGEPKPLR